MLHAKMYLVWSVAEGMGSQQAIPSTYTWSDLFMSC